MPRIISEKDKNAYLNAVYPSIKHVENYELVTNFSTAEYKQWQATQSQHD
jgi:hypothetical protein